MGAVSLTGAGAPEGSAAISMRVYACCGAANTASTAPVSTISPSFITATRSATRRTTFRSWLISTSANPRRAFSAASRSRMPAWIVTSSAVVGSSAMSSLGSLASAIAIITRCRWPPESWWGNASSRVTASAKPTRASNAATASREARRPCSAIASPTCRPIRCSGLRLVIGSWNTIPAVPPRMRCSVRGPAARTSCPSSVIRPEAAAPGGSSRKTDRAVSDLPDPLSPTRASVSPGSIWNDTPSTTRRGPKAIERLSTTSIALGLSAPRGGRQPMLACDAEEFDTAVIGGRAMSDPLRPYGADTLIIPFTVVRSGPDGRPRPEPTAEASEGATAPADGSRPSAVNPLAVQGGEVE